VIAPKNSPPFIRFAGDYRPINPYIIIGHEPIPHVLQSLDIIKKYKVFADLDMANSFHQFLLSFRTSELLSVQTPWGQVAPKFMPEGVGPASGILQAAMRTFFQDFGEWCIVIFDNILICAHDYPDLYNKVKLVLDKCIEHNIVLKFSKSFLGNDYANFFGYVVRYMEYVLSQERKDSIMKIPFPNSKKLMQSFLGSALFFKPFVPNYSVEAAKLYDMTKDTFPWKHPELWQVDYKSIFEQFKHKLFEALNLQYPDYDLEWILRVDA
jgi:hypothetical protein